MKINANFNERVVINANEMSWTPSPMPGVERKMLDRIGEEIARASGTRLELPYVGGLLGKFRRVSEKARENIIAKRLEERFTKEEIITMYLNQ
jgi:hypothetical protein